MKNQKKIKFKLVNMIKQQQQIRKWFSSAGATRRTSISNGKRNRLAKQRKYIRQLCLQNVKIIGRGEKKSGGKNDYNNRAASGTVNGTHAIVVGGLGPNALNREQSQGSRPKTRWPGTLSNPHPFSMLKKEREESATKTIALTISLKTLFFLLI